MVETKSVVEQLTEFNKIIDDLQNIDVKLDDEDKALLLLNSLPRSFEHFKDALLYARSPLLLSRRSNNQLGPRS